ncbi:alpha/beta fold hydrolase [Oceanobacter sp. 3_MG-2023]|uniref:alpha/beta fold hydrolase n=1 Tax=Oceanobacter sp. 3_MG-2023 TaxID=3062622 RepID=UPI002733E0A1|nr:alpha/beta hydrolase [Oceanobacter sp. 3_MG-2023]MDP2504957.1 alpha/beta hydrolase [Oceanobacter sp. 3_MG-2023]
MNTATCTTTLIQQLDDFPRQSIRLGDVNQSWRESGPESGGNGEVLVLLHGISSGSGSWVQQLAALETDCRVLAWDAPGYGDSDDLSVTGANAKDYAERLAHWLDALGIQRCWLVGHSLGAMVAAAFAARYPQRLAGLMLASPAQGYGQADAETRERVYRQRPTMLAQLGPAGLAAQRAAALVSVNASAAQVSLVADGMRQLRLSGFQAASWLLANDDIWSYLPVDVESRRVICGAADTITPPQAARQLASDLDTTEFVEIAAAGHACYVEAAAAVNQALKDWMSSATSRTGTSL